MVKCKICHANTKFVFSHKIMKKYKGNYYKCDKCGFLFANKPTWLKEAYKNSITSEDTGLEERNILFAEKTSIILKTNFKDSKNFLDYAGGYGLFSKLMKDNGFNFYWTDPYTKNIYSKELTWNKKDKIDFITCFECLEHFKEPNKELQKIFSISKNVLFSTTVLPEPIPKPDWIYYGFNHGQHIAFYEEKTLKYIANNNGLNYYKIGNLQLITKKQINLNKTLIYLYLFYKIPRVLKLI